MDESPQPHPPRPKRHRRLRLAVLLITPVLILAVYLPLRAGRANEQLTLRLMAHNAEGVRDALDHGADPDLPIRLPGVVYQSPPHTLTEYMRQILRHMIRPDAHKPKTALMFAVNNGDAKSVEVLLQHNANVNLRLENGYSALLYAASYRQSEIVAALVAKGADVQAYTQDGITSLMFAVVAGQTETVRLLLTKGADPHAIDFHSQTALSLATEYRHEEIIQMLLAAGADARDLNSVQPSRSNANRLFATGLGIVTVNGKRVFVPSGGAVRLNPPPQHSGALAPLVFAAKYGSPSLLQFLWERATPDVQQKAGWELLCNAVQSGKVEPVRYLLSRNVPVNPMHSATPEVPPSFQVRPGYVPSQVYTPLHYAVAQPTSEIAALLIERGANVNAEDMFGTTPLLAAVVGGHPATVRLLIAHGANVKASEHTSGQNALMRGIHDVEVARLLLDDGLEVNARDHNGRTALMQCFTVPVATLLLERGADVNARDVLGHTALMNAVQSFQTPYVAFLLKHGANVQSADNQGNTPLSMARAMRATTLSALLIAAGAKK